jgi:hypothetical protein
MERPDVVDLEMAQEDMQLLERLDENLRTCWDPTHEPKSVQLTAAARPGTRLKARFS